MKMEERDRLIREEGEHKGREEGKAEGKVEELVRIVCKLIEKNKSPKEIADLLDEEEEYINAICQAVKLCGPACDYGEISEILIKEMK